jgi:type IV secretion system protein TrbI
MNTNSGPSEKVDPEHLALRAEPRPVTRLNRRMIALLAAVLAGALLGATMWSLQTPHRTKPSSPELHISDNVTHAEKLDSIARDYSELPPQLGEPRPGDWGVVEANRDTQRRAASNATGQPRAESHAAGAVDQITSAPLQFRTSATADKKANEQSTDIVTAPAPMSNPFAAMPSPASSTDPTQLQNLQNRKENFMSDREADGTRAGGTLLPPPSPYAVMAGTVISAALVTGIKSDLPGKIIATVTEPVYDPLTGKSTLIPQGSRLLGEYDSQVAFGQRRVLVVWTRLILPDTSSISLDRLPAVDEAGYAGLEDDVDWHWSRVFAGAAVSTLIGVGAELAAPDRQSGEGRIVLATRDSVQDSVNQVGQELTRRNLNVQPTLTERPGLPLRVIVNRDLILRPYQPLFYERTGS